MFVYRVGAVLLLASALVALQPASSEAQTSSRDTAGLRSPSDASLAADTAAGDDDTGAKFLAIGAGIGTPGGMSFIAGGYFAPVFLQVSGGYWGVRWNGFQGEVGLLFNSSPSFAHGISVIVGTFRVNPVLANAGGTGQETSRMVHYTGAAYDAFLSGFYVQIGLARGVGDYPNPQLLMQFGYLFAF